MSNRIEKELSETLPQPKGPFTDAEALELLMAYRKDPSNVPCPLCGPDTVEVLAFIEPQIDPNGFASVTEPEGEYAGHGKTDQVAGVKAVPESFGWSPLRPSPGAPATMSLSQSV